MGTIHIEVTPPPPLGMQSQGCACICVKTTLWHRGYPCFGLAAIFAVMLYNVQIIQKSSTRNIMHMNIIVLKLPAKLLGVID